MSLEQTLLKLKPREEAGSTTSGNYDYQKDLSLFMLLQKHETLDDYVFLFDFHEDLIILDSSTAPQMLDFYQIKSKNSNNWTIRALTKGEKDKLSIIGKLYSNKVNFKNNTNSLNFISNAKFSFKTLNDGSSSLAKTKIIASDLHVDDRGVCNTSLIKEHKLLNNPEFEKLGEFHVTILSNKDSQTHCVGELNKLINKLNVDNTINPELAYKQIINEVSRKTRTTVSDKSIANLEELIEMKGISKLQFVDYLKQAGLYRSVKDEWADIKVSLELCGMGFLEVKKYRKSWVDLSATLIKDSNKIPLNSLIKEVGLIVSQEEKNGNFDDKMNLLQIINHCSGMIASSIYDDYFIKCLIIYKINEE